MEERKHSSKRGEGRVKSGEGKREKERGQKK